jgi:hypothetical protein
VSVHVATDKPIKVYVADMKCRLTAGRKMPISGKPSFAKEIVAGHFAERWLTEVAGVTLTQS